MKGSWISLNYFLGVKVIATPNVLFLSQQKYVRDLQEKFDMLHSKETTTPMASNAKLKLHDGTGEANANTSRNLTGSLQYYL